MPSQEELLKVMNSKSVELFISYSHEDEEMCNELLKHLSVLKRDDTISIWHDRKITPGEQWKGIIDQRLNSANIILLLVSPDFVSSHYCYDIEMKRALSMHVDGVARVIPIILRPVDWFDTPMSNIQALPKDAKPVSTWEIKDEAYVDIVRGVKKIIHEYASSTLLDNSRVKTSDSTSKSLKSIEGLLDAGYWIKADEASRQLLKHIFSAVPLNGNGGIIDVDDKHDLEQLDKCWLKYSRSHFGISIQKRVWHRIPAYSERESWKRLADFGIRLEWLSKAELNRSWELLDILGQSTIPYEARLRWYSYNSIIERIHEVNDIEKLPTGFLPFLIPLDLNGNPHNEGLSIGRAWPLWYDNYFQILDSCGL